MQYQRDRAILQALCNLLRAVADAHSALGGADHAVEEIDLLVGDLERIVQRLRRIGRDAAHLCDITRGRHKDGEQPTGKTGALHTGKIEMAAVKAAENLFDRGVWLLHP